MSRFFMILLLCLGLLSCSPPDPLDELLSENDLDPCIEEPDAKECQQISDACIADDNNASLCESINPCISDPNEPECQDIEIPDIPSKKVPIRD